MILNSESVQLIRANASRLAQSIGSKDDLSDLATASNFEQVFSAIETILTNTSMFFDDELLALLDESNWRGFKAALMVYTFNIVNRNLVTTKELPVYNSNDFTREYEGASSHA